MISRKMILTGNFGVGKTSLFNKFVFNTFSDKYLTTIGVKVNKKNITVDDVEVSLMIWDVAGEVSQDKIPTSYFLGSSCIVYIFDLNRAATFKEIEEEIKYLEQLVPNSLIFIVGNKKDLLTEEELKHQLNSISRKVDLLTSAKTGENVENLFMSIARELKS